MHIADIASRRNYLHNYSIAISSLLKANINSSIQKRFEVVLKHLDNIMIHILMWAIRTHKHFSENNVNIYAIIDCT